MANRAGKSKGLTTSKPLEFERGIIATTAVNTEVNDDIDLVLEGQAALVAGVEWQVTSPLSETMSIDAVNDIIAILSMDEDEAIDIDTNYPTLLDDEDILDFYRSRYINALTTSGEVWAQTHWREYHDFSFMGGILVPETVRLRAIVDAEVEDVTHTIVATIYYYRIEKPTRAQIDYLYRRR